MARITNQDVQNLTGLDQCDTTQFIEIAHLFVEEELVGQNLSEDRLRILELFLAAHFTALSEEGGSLVSDKMGDAEQKWANNFGEGLSATRFGQQAIAFDNSGTLSEMATVSKKARLTVV